MLRVFVLLLAFVSAAHATPVRITPAAQRRAPASAFRLRLIGLASDPAHGGEITAGSLREAYVGLRLERERVLPGPIKRDPTGSAEFHDAAGVRWDVKGFHSEWPVEHGGFVLSRAEQTIDKELAAGQNVILDRRNLTPAHARDLGDLVQRRGWASRVVWY